MTSIISQVKAAKISQACDLCRSLKIRCQAGPTTELCQKCSQSGRSLCVFTTRQPRPTRYRKSNSKARIEALEKKLDAVLARSAYSLNSASAITTPDENALNIEPSISIHDFPKANGYNDVSDILRSCGVSLEAAEQYVLRFQSMSGYYPFVVLPSDASFVKLARRTPFLCLAITCIASSSDMDTQRQIELAFRKKVLQMLTIDGERSLDLLQALLVYLAWYHFFSTPKRDQSYMLIQLAVSMCTDLGLDLTPSEAMRRPFDLRLEHYRRHSERDIEHDDFFSMDARRAYLGCYYIAAQHRTVFGKPTRMSVTNHVSICAQSIADAPEYESDMLILPLIKLQQLSDEYHDYLLIARTDPQANSDLATIRSHLETLQEKVTTWGSSVPRIPTAPLILEIASQYTQVHAHELDYVNPIIRRYRTDGSFSDLDSRSSPIRLEIILLCFRSTLAIIELFLQIHPDDYTLLSNIQWLPLISSTVYLYRFCTGLPHVPEWDVRLARTAIDLGSFLETISVRFEHVMQRDPRCKDSNHPKVFFAMLGPIFEDVKHTWESLRDMPTEMAMNGHIKAHKIEFSSDVKAEKTGDNPMKSHCPAKSFWIGQRHSLDLNPEVSQSHDHAWESQYELSQAECDQEMIPGDTDQILWLDQRPTESVSNQMQWVPDFDIT